MTGFSPKYVRSGTDWPCSSRKTRSKGIGELSFWSIPMPFLLTKPLYFAVVSPYCARAEDPASNRRRTKRNGLHVGVSRNFVRAKCPRTALRNRVNFQTTPVRKIRAPEWSVPDALFKTVIPANAVRERRRDVQIQHCPWIDSGGTPAWVCKIFVALVNRHVTIRILRHIETALSLLCASS